MMNNVVRHPSSNAVLSTDVAGLNKYKQERALHRKVTRLGDEVHEIRELLATVCDRLDKIEKS
tara:strand:- start:89 stop:277 length:189 start_codon:yes stop_codon:yes gene_type:complete